MTCAGSTFGLVPQGDVEIFLFQMTHVFPSLGRCRFPEKRKERLNKLQQECEESESEKSESEDKDHEVSQSF